MYSDHEFSPPQSCSPRHKHRLTHGHHDRGRSVARTVSTTRPHRPLKPLFHPPCSILEAIRAPRRQRARTFRIARSYRCIYMRTIRAVREISGDTLPGHRATLGDLTRLLATAQRRSISQRSPPTVVGRERLVTRRPSHHRLPLTRHDRGHRSGAEARRALLATPAEASLELAPNCSTQEFAHRSLRSLRLKDAALYPSLYGFTHRTRPAPRLRSYAVPEPALSPSAALL